MSAQPYYPTPAPPPRRRRRRSPLRWLVRLLLVLLIVALGLFVALFVSSSGLRSFGGELSGARLERARRSPNFKDGQFVNPVPTDTMEPGTLFTILKEQLFGGEQRVPAKPVEVVSRKAADYATAPPLRVTWMGHATVLLEIDGRRVLTDPIWSERASPSTWVGPERFHPPPIALEELPPIDAVVISHDHFDHLDMATIVQLVASGARFFVPLGIGAHLEVWGVPLERITELDWHDTAELQGLKLIATPARHYSGRNPLKANQTLWASWVIQGPTKRAFFSGDSGYFDRFTEIGKRYGPMDVALVKVGASHWTWADIHMQPEDALRTALDVRARLLVPIHWGTFNLALHDWNEPADRIVAAAQKAAIQLVVPRPGELVDGSAPPHTPWWR